VLDEIRYLIREFDIEHIEFEDDNLTLDKERAARIFEGIEEINKTCKAISWSTPNGVRVDTLDKKMLTLIKRSGCLSLSFGVESGDPMILKRMNKQLDLEKVVEAVRGCKELSLRANIFLMLGYPGEDRESFFSTVMFVKRLISAGAEVFYSGITRAYPGTDLFKSCQAKGYLPQPAAREDIFLDNIITPGNAIITPDFNPGILRKRLNRIEKLTVPLYLRLYHRHFHIVKKVIPDRVIQKIKNLK
jgi:radical SAM superfamily enzyme YgiQ (UPF0313 family)